DCDLTGAQFSQAGMDGTRFARCDLTGIGGVTSMTGAILAHQDLVALSYAFAGALGVRIEDPDEE
ncbi:pentapeptide repeat-containing protein, partial [Micromonospora matsumotoense]|uniref:pentapeptide repeat-containing protein n=1 Tax=Micromonospora matsumotoense TaxID=121616 RepID=UPI0033E470BB